MIATGLEPAYPNLQAGSQTLHLESNNVAFRDTTSLALTLSQLRTVASPRTPEAIRMCDSPVFPGVICLRIVQNAGKDGEPASFTHLRAVKLFVL